MWKTQFEETKQTSEPQKGMARTLEFSDQEFFKKYSD